MVVARRKNALLDAGGNRYYVQTLADGAAAQLRERRTQTTRRRGDNSCIHRTVDSVFLAPTFLRTLRIDARLPASARPRVGAAPFDRL